MGTQFADIFKKLEKIETRPLKPVREVWKKVSPTVYKCLLTGRELNNLEFFRYQTSVGPEYFIVEILK